MMQYCILIEGSGREIIGPFDRWDDADDYRRSDPEERHMSIFLMQLPAPYDAIANRYEAAARVSFLNGGPHPSAQV